jgi:glutamine synthetase
LANPRRTPTCTWPPSFTPGSRAWRPGCPRGPSADDPYTIDAGRLPANLAAAIDALEADAELTRATGSRFVPYYAALKRAEIARFEQAVKD